MSPKECNHGYEPMGIEQLEQQTREISNAASKAILDAMDKAAQRAVEEKIGKTGIPKRFLQKRMSDFKVTLDGQHKALKQCVEYTTAIDQAIDTGRSIIMAGNTRTGKTHLACAILSRALSLGYSGRFTVVPDLLRSIRGSFSEGNSEKETIDLFCDVHLLVLDEVGEAIGNEEKRRTMLFDVLNRRYNDMKPTIITSNLGYKGITAYLGKKVVMRLEENEGLSVAFDWEGRKDWT